MKLSARNQLKGKLVEVKDVLDHEKLEALYRAPAKRLADPETGAVASLPG